MKKLCAIVPAAGFGVRLHSKTAKPYIILNNKPLLWYCLNALANSQKIDSIIVVSKKDNIKRAVNLIKKYKIKKVKAVIAGGESRTESVYNGIKVLDKDTDYVLIHDGARPFLDNRIIDRCVKEVIKHKAVVCAVRCSCTIKRADKRLNVIGTLDRNSLWQVQTPQVFDYQLIKQAYEKFINKKAGVFDDAALVERLGRRVKIVCGSNENIKITTPEDFNIARALLKINK